MEFSKHNFKNPNSEMIQGFLENLERLDIGLKKILAQELKEGNRIGSVSRRWPQEHSTIVELTNRMRLDYKLSGGVFYNHLNDPHYWIHEYTTFDGKDTSRCDILVSR